MDDAQANGAQDAGLIPADVRVPPHATIRNPRPGGLVSDVDPDRLPTETIARGGRRLAGDGTGAQPDSPPETRARYEVIGKISEGGMGVVYDVRENSLRRQVALKICRAEFGPNAPGAQEVEEFANEACMTARLDHPGVVPIYALAKDSDGRPFFAMKKVVGTGWNDLLHPDRIQDPRRRAAVEARARSMTAKDHLAILLKVCDAVAYAHSKAILHRDLKPENVMLGDFGEVYVMDWGLALYFDERNEYKRFPDLKPQLAGTPAYIAPEMVRGELAALGPATDVYLLGGILYEILAGRPPHDGDTVMDVLRAAARGDVVPPASVPGAPPVDPDLARIAQKALAPRIPNRYPSVADFQRDLRAYLANAESMAVCRRAAGLFAAVRRELENEPASAARAPRKTDKETAAIEYGKLSECIGGFRQAVELWPGNSEARRGRLDALALQIRLALRQDDLTYARAQFRLLDALKSDAADPRLAADAEAQSRELAAQLDARQARIDRAARQARAWKAAAVALGLLLLAGIAGIVAVSLHQRSVAVRGEKKMFAASVSGRAQMLEQFLFGIEQIAVLYRQSAVELISVPADRLPWREPTPAGRDGYYYDEDFYDPATRPPGLVFNPRYQADVSLAFPTLVRSPWARDEAHRAAVEDAAARLGRLNTLFSHVHRTRYDVQWSLAGSAAGLLVGFPGFGRYRDKPDYDATRRAWYLAAIQAPSDRPVWGLPYADATTRRILMSCTCRIRQDQRVVGAVGLEITLESMQKMLLDFSGPPGSRRRALLIRPIEETDPATETTRTAHRVVVDTLDPRSAASGQSDLKLVDAEDVGDDIATYYREVLDGRRAPGVCRETGRYWLAHAPIKNGAWTFIAGLERGGRASAP